MKFVAQRVLGRGLRFWPTRTGPGTASLGRLLSRPPAQPVLDDGRYRAAGQPERRATSTGADGAELVWPDRAEGGGRHDRARHRTPLRPARPDGFDGALDAAGSPRHREGLTIHMPGPAFVGLERQRSPSSNSPRGQGRDADRVARCQASRPAYR
ncbi:hypothetical protein [Streptomyces pimonensis]|uniref:hypothetical protein n=1 Tax=Streptomyces pimonensis TaxID=2860288 RepID=UPI0035289ABB